MNKKNIVLFCCIILLSNIINATQKSSLELAVDSYNIEEVIKISSFNYRINKNYKESILQALELAEKNKLALSNPFYWASPLNRLKNFTGIVAYGYCTYFNLINFLEFNKELDKEYDILNNISNKSFDINRFREKSSCTGIQITIAIWSFYNASKCLFDFMAPTKELAERLKKTEIIRIYLESILAIIQQEEQRSAQV